MIKKMKVDDFMTIMEAMAARHSVRQYEDKPLAAEAVQVLEKEIAACNLEGGLHIQLVTGEPKAFSGMMAHYGKFSGVNSYIALVGPKNAKLEEKCGYYGERLVLLAQILGLNTCWVALTYSKIPGAFQVNAGEKLTVVISVGYGKNQGSEHKQKAAGDVANVADGPEWFQKGVEAALLAPTAMNQQKFRLTYADGKVQAKAELGFYTKVDLGIVKYHFEQGAGKDSSIWA